MDEALADNTQTPPDDQAAFRIDFPAWLQTHTDRNRWIVEAMMLGHQTQELARRFGVSAARISQLRRDFMIDWERFCSNDAANA